MVRKAAVRNGPVSRYEKVPGVVRVKGGDPWPQFRGVAKDVLEWVTECGAVGPAARRAGIHPVTVWRWIGADPEFGDAIKEAMEVAVQAMEGSLYERARGLNGHKPDTIAAIFWLKRHRPEYRDNVQVDVKHSGSVGVVDLGRFAPETVRLMLAQAAQRYLPAGEDVIDEATD